MTDVVGPDGEIILEKQILDRLGVQPGWKTVQIVVDNHVRIYFLPLEHRRSQYGAAKPFIQHYPSPDENWDEQVERFVGEEFQRKFRDTKDEE